MGFNIEIALRLMIIVIIMMRGGLSLCPRYNRMLGLLLRSRIRSLGHESSCHTISAEQECTLVCQWCTLNVTLS